ncbi:MAG: hypothetical protein JO266_21865, partial [Acidobacteria bacterium]|nr:hypothetical protein [Acidobacteriota bacterium]
MSFPSRQWLVGQLLATGGDGVDTQVQWFLWRENDGWGYTLNNAGGTIASPHVRATGTVTWHRMPIAANADPEAFAAA